MIADVRWGDVGTWVGSIAVSVSLAVLAISVRQQRNEVSRQVGLERNAQARLVCAWHDFESNPGSPTLAHMTVLNASPVTVRNVRGFLFDSQGVLQSSFDQIRILSPGETVRSVTVGTMPADVVLQFSFDDEAGCSWQKYGRPALREISLRQKKSTLEGLLANFETR